MIMANFVLKINSYNKRRDEQIPINNFDYV